MSMPEAKAHKAKPTARKRWLDTLLDRMSAPAAIMRQHLGNTNQNASLGSAAEKGVRDLLSLVLPGRIVVTSGFIREPGGSLTEHTLAEAISPQTDVVLYDGSHAIPLHRLGDVDIVAAPDVIGVIEVKDTVHGSNDLASAEGKDGALAHMAKLGYLAPEAFRAIVLFSGKERDTKEEENKDRNAKSKGGRPSSSEIEIAKSRLDKAQLIDAHIPHVIYCASYAIEDGKIGSYLAFYDFLNRQVRIHEYHEDPTRALTGFLHIITGFFVVRGMISPSLHLDLIAATPNQNVIAKTITSDASQSFKSLHEHLLNIRRTTNNGSKDFFHLLVTLLKENTAELVWKVVTGSNVDKLPTAGVGISVDFKSQENAPSRITYLAFFYLKTSKVFVCTDASGEENQQWKIDGETVDEYLRRARNESGRSELMDSAGPMKSLKAY